MNQRFLPVVFFTLSLIICVPPNTLFAQSEQADQLEEVRSELERLEQQKAETEIRQSTTHRQLGEIEQKSSQLRKKIRNTQKRRNELDNSLEKVRQDHESLLADMDSRREQLKSSMTLSFAISRLDPLKLLLSENDPARISRTVAYYRYFTNSQIEQINELMTLQRDIEHAQQKIMDSQNELVALAEQLATQESDLKSSQQQKQKLLASLDRELATTEQKIKNAKVNERRLLKLITDLKTESPTQPRQVGNFSTMKGKLQLPLDAPITNRYGDAKRIAGLTWEGVMLSPQPEQEVSAIFSGQVVYADWLQGFGQLMIIDHGEGYLSLYAHNEWLTKSIGDAVSTGEVIALAGSTGGLREPGLYFEIRENNMPQDPLLWCRRS